MSISKPILLDFPTHLRTPRLMIRSVMPDDGDLINAAVVETIDALAPWFPWATPLPTVEDTEEVVRRFYADFILRKAFHGAVFVADHFVGMCGFNTFKWDVPSGDIGYWCRSKAQGQGYITEAVQAFVHYGFQRLGLKRITLLIDDENIKSRKIAERLNFTLESRGLGTIVNPQCRGALRIGCRYVRFDDNALPDLNVSW